MRSKLILGCLLALLSTPAFAVISGTNSFGAGNTSCDADLTSGSSVNAPLGNMIAVCVTTEVASGTAVLPTVAGNSGVVFTQIETITSATPTLRTTLFVGISNGVNATLAVGISANQSNCTYSVAHFSGVDTVTPIRQSRANASAVGSTGLATPFLTTFGDAANNAVYACFGHDTTTAPNIADPVIDFIGTSGCCGSRTVHGWKVGEESSVIVNGVSGLYLGIVAEINFGTAPAGTRRRIAPRHQSSMMPDFLFPWWEDFLTPLRGGYAAG